MSGFPLSASCVLRWVTRSWGPRTNPHMEGTSRHGAPPVSFEEEEERRIWAPALASNGTTCPTVAAAPAPPPPSAPIPPQCSAQIVAPLGYSVPQSDVWPPIRACEADASLVSYTCRFPGCCKVYSSSDGARKHARTHHPEWLKEVEVQKRAVDAYCTRSEGVVRPQRASAAVPLPLLLQQAMMRQQQAVARLADDFEV